MFVGALLLNLAGRRAAHGAELLHVADGGVRVSLRTAPRHVDGVCQRPAGHALMTWSPGDLRTSTTVDRRPRTLARPGGWGGVLIVTGYLMGTLYEHKNATDPGAARDLSRRPDDPPALRRRRTSTRKIIRTACRCTRRDRGAPQAERRADRGRARGGLLHDIGKLDISRELLYKAARLTSDEYQQIQQHVGKGVEMLETVGGSLRRVIPIVLAHHDKFDGSGYHPTRARKSRSRRASSRSPTSTIR